VVRTIVNANLPAGYHTILWDGSDDGGTDLPAGAYPYSMNANDPDSGALLFHDILVATVDCTVATRVTSWGRIKAIFTGK
jgi:flagellar hook assembly protein FlgD